MEINLLNYFCRSKILSPNQIREIKSLDSNIETCQDMSKYWKLEVIKDQLCTLLRYYKDVKKCHSCSTLGPWENFKLAHWSCLPHTVPSKAGGSKHVTLFVDNSDQNAVTFINHLQIKFKIFTQDYSLLECVASATLWSTVKLLQPVFIAIRSGDSSDGKCRLPVRFQNWQCVIVSWGKKTIIFL